MAKKLELLEQAKKMKLEVSSKNTISEIEKAISKVSSHQSPVASKAKEAVQETKDKGLETTAKPLAKAGKRSEKALKEAEEKIDKEERKAKGNVSPKSEDAEHKAKKGPKPVTRPLIERRGKK